MSVTLMVEFEESPALNVDLQILQFVGIADHSQLSNRDMAEQHPIGAITGLSERHTLYDRTLLPIDETLSAREEVLGSFAETLTEHTQTLIALSESSQEQAQSIQSMDETLSEHGLALGGLNEFAANVATQNDIQEVLGNA